MEALLLTLDVFLMLLLARSVTKVESSSKDKECDLGLFAFSEQSKTIDYVRRD
jgi:hypothetical protein